MSARAEISDRWDATVAAFLSGREPHLEDAELARWFPAYSGGGRGAVTTEAFPEPYIGPLHPRHGEPRVLTLGLNPGQADLEFQGRSGHFAAEIARLGGFSAWAATAPYLRDPWRAAHPKNPYHEARLAFARRWTGDGCAQSRDVLVMELFPWHSDKVTATMRPTRDVLDRFVWAPLACFDDPNVFAFGSQWLGAARAIGLIQAPIELPFNVPGRQGRVFGLPSGQRLVVVWQTGYAGPPGAPDVEVLRQALGAQRVRPKRSPLASPAPRPAPVPSVLPAPRRAGRPQVGRHAEFWNSLVGRLRRELPAMQVGSPQRNDLPLYRPLPRAQLKLNFPPSQGLRLELLLASTDREENDRHLALLTDRLPRLQELLGAAPVIVREPLPNRTQARIAVYLAGALIEHRREWPAFEDWCVEVLTRFRAALDEVVPELRRRW